MKIEVDSKLESAKTGDIFVAVNGSENCTPYLIGRYKDNFTLTNMQSGYTNYEAETIEDLVKKYLFNNQESRLGLVKKYFFVKGSTVTISNGKSFGHTPTSSYREKQ